MLSLLSSTRKTIFSPCTVGNDDIAPYRGVVLLAFYIAAAAALGSGLWGIENQIDPGDPVVGNAYEKEFSKDLRFPATLADAAERLKASEAARELFGDVFVDHYAATRIWESKEFQRHVTDWEMDRYFEII